MKEPGFKKGSDGYFQPNYGPQKGKDLTFTIQSTSGNTIRSQTEELFQAQMKAIGIKINIQNYDANTFFGTNLPNGTYPDRRVRLGHHAVRVGQPADLLLVHQRANCGENWNHSANAQVDSLMAAGSSAPSQSEEIYGLQQGRRHPVAEHGDPAAVPEAAVLGLVQQPQGRPAQHLERRRHLERRELDRSASRGAAEREGGVGRAVGPSLNVPSARRIRPCSPTSLGAF